MVTTWDTVKVTFLTVQGTPWVGWTRKWSSTTLSVRHGYWISVLRPVRKLWCLTKFTLFLYTLLLSTVPITISVPFTNGPKRDVDCNNFYYRWITSYRMIYVIIRLPPGISKVKPETSEHNEQKNSDLILTLWNTRLLWEISTIN